MCELKLLNDSLMKENVSKDREIRQLNKDAQQYEQTILNLREEISTMNYHTPDVSKRDAEVMAGMCWTGTECGDWEPVKDFSEMLRVETEQFQDRIQKMESNLKASSESVRALRKVNVSLTDEMHAMRRVCAALVEESRAATVRAQFKDDIIREMRRQLKQAKAKVKNVTEATIIKSKDFVSGDGECPRGSSVSYDSVTIACVRAQPRRKRDVPLRDSLHRDNTSRGNTERDGVRGSAISNAIGDGTACETTHIYDRGTALNESEDDILGNHMQASCCDGATSTPDVSKKVNADTSPDVSIIERSPSPPILVSDASIEDPEDEIKKCSFHLTPSDPSTSNSDQQPPDNCSARRSPRICSGSAKTCLIPSTSKACAGLNISNACSGPHSPRTCQSPCTSKTCLSSRSPSNRPGSQAKPDSAIRSPKMSPNSRPLRICPRPRSQRTCPCPETPVISDRQHSACPCSSKIYVICLGPKTPRICPCPITSVVCLEPPLPQSSSGVISPRPCIETKTDFPRGKNVQTQIPERKDKCQECFEELFSNIKSKKSDESVSEVPCGEEDCKRAEKMTSPCNVETLKTQFVNRSSSAIYKDSGGACSLVDSATGTCDANTRATYYHNKLRSTLRILQNKEETIRVQAESLSVAEGRISTLTERATELRRELEQKSKELQALRKTLECCRVEKVDAAIEAESTDRLTETTPAGYRGAGIGRGGRERGYRRAVSPLSSSPLRRCTPQEMENQSDIVNTLQNNLSVIEDLYRECFYETAKQEGLIDMLRKSYLDVRLMDKQKADQIGRMQTVINTQKWSLDRCQDIALEVDNLKMEISNFLSSSNTSTNYDSGMWERSEESFASVPGVQEELQDVMEQLLRLREILSLGCICGLEEENMRSKRENEALEKRIADMCGRKCELEQTLVIKDSQAKQHKEGIESREEQLATMRQEMVKLREEVREKTTVGEQLSKQLRQSQVLLQDKSEELSQMKEQCDSQRETINQLQQETKKAENICKENCKIRNEVAFLSAQVAQWRSQLLDSECRARKLEAKLQQSQACYREKESSVAELQSQLEQAHARGAELCGDARRALAAVRHWAKRMRDRHREHENIIKQKNSYIASLQRRLEEHNSTSVYTSTIDADPPCSKCSTVSRQTSCCPKREAKQSQCFDPCASEVASCSSAPTPPKRLFRKKPICGEKRAEVSWMCEESVQHPMRQDACVDPRLPQPFCTCTATTSRGVSPPAADELFSRVEQLSKALADGYRRWTKADPR